jgi:hypothetical protein
VSRDEVGLCVPNGIASMPSMVGDALFAAMSAGGISAFTADSAL